MVTRTNFLWVGDLVSQLLSILVSIAAVVLLLPYLLGGSSELLAFTYIVYFFFGFVTLINLGIILWRWLRMQRRIAAICAQPAQWLVRWRYDHWTWQQYAQSERTQAYGAVAKWSIPFLLISAIVAYMWSQVLDQQVLGPLLTIIGLNLGVLFLQGAVLPYYRILNTAPEAIITAEGLCIGGNAYFWQQGNANLQSVDLAPGQPGALAFKLRVRRGRNRSTQVVRVPVLPGHETQAQQVVTALTPKT